jgi:hypothetical protein
MKTLYLILAILFYIIGTIIGLNQKINGRQDKVSQFESRYPLLSSLIPTGQPIFTLIFVFIFIYLFFSS